MKFIFALSIGIFFLCCKDVKDNRGEQDYDQSNKLTDHTTSSTEDSLILKVCDYFEESTEGGEIRGFYRKTDLKRIELELFSELGKVYKEFRNTDVADSFYFEQRFIFYDRPFNEKEVTIVDSAFFSAKYSREGIVEKKVTGNRLSTDGQKKILASIESDRQRYTRFLETCNNTLDN